MRCIIEWHTYFVNGYKFHTKAWSNEKKTINCGVYVKDLTESGYNDFYGTIRKIYELKYNTCTSPKRVVVFFIVNGLILLEEVQEWILGIILLNFK